MSLKTYQENKMETKKIIAKYNELFTLKVSHQKKQLIIEKSGKYVSLNFIKDATDIAIILNEMQKQTLIGFEDLEDLKNLENELWNHTKIISDWNTTKELLDKIEETSLSKKICIHLFNINETINLNDVSEIIKSVDLKGYTSKTSLFNVSLSTDHINTYVALYVDIKNNKIA